MLNQSHNHSWRRTLLHNSQVWNGCKDPLLAPPCHFTCVEEMMGINHPLQSYHNRSACTFAPPFFAKSRLVNPYSSQNLSARRERKQSSLHRALRGLSFDTIASTPTIFEHGYGSAYDPWKQPALASSYRSNGGCDTDPSDTSSIGTVTCTAHESETKAYHDEDVANNYTTTRRTWSTYAPSYTTTASQ